MLAFTAHNENKSKTFMSALLSCRTIERSSLQLKETNMFTVFFRSRGFAFVLLQKACKIIAQESRSWIFTLQFFLWSETEVVLDTSSWHDEYNCESEIALLFRRLLACCILQSVAFFSLLSALAIKLDFVCCSKTYKRFFKNASNKGHIFYELMFSNTNITNFSWLNGQKRNQI